MKARSPLRVRDRLSQIALGVAVWCACAATCAAAPDAGAAKPESAQAASKDSAATPSLSLTLSPDGPIKTGDLLTVHLVVVARPDIAIAVPEQSFGELELLDRRADVTASDQETKHSFEIDLLALTAGDLELPAVRVRAVDEKGEVTDLRTEPRPVKVVSRIANEPNAEPKPESAPVVVVQDDYTLLWVLGTLLAVGLVAALTLLIARWLRQKPKPTPPPAPERPPWELALDKLGKLQSTRDELLQNGRGVEFVDAVSDTLREYLGKRYNFDGLESTSDEVLSALTARRPQQLSLSGVSLLLSQCDLVKFAKLSPDRTMCDDLWNGAHGLICATMPRVAANPTAEAPPDPRAQP